MRKKCSSDVIKIDDETLYLKEQKTNSEEISDTNETEDLFC